MEMRGGEDFRYFDPKQLRSPDASQLPKHKTPFTEAIVFMIGGGNYIEYQNLVDYTRVSNNKSKWELFIFNTLDLFGYVSANLFNFL